MGPTFSGPFSNTQTDSTLGSDKPSSATRLQEKLKKLKAEREAKEGKAERVGPELNTAKVSHAGRVDKADKQEKSQEKSQDNFQEKFQEKRPRPVESLVEKELPLFLDKQKWMSKIHQGFWVLGLFLLLRLIFSNRGILDYYNMDILLQNKTSHWQSIHIENQELRKEIVRLHKDPLWQKKITKEHLGVISSEEFVILFAQEKPQKSN